MLKTDLKVPSSNSLSTFLPLRTKDKHYKFCWETVLGYFVHSSYNKALITTDLEGFKKLCKHRFSDLLDEPEFWSEIEGMYFENEELFKISPELLMFKAVKGEIDTNSKKLGDMFIGLLNGYTVESSPETNLNFLEKEIKSEFDAFYVSTKLKQNEDKSTVAYLPFLTSCFQQDLKFLNDRPQYLVNQFPAFLRLYGFLYIAQMALNIKDWRNGAPSSKPCFFIVDNEKASRERSQVKNFGYTQLNEYLEYLFPYLVMNETLQEKGRTKPLWHLADSIKESAGALEQLNNFSTQFFEQRSKFYKFTSNSDNSNEVNDALMQLLNLSYWQFDSKKGTLEEYNQTAVKGVLKTICAPFIQRRGQAGQVLTFNQDYVVLLTNLAIGEKERLRFHELIKAFEQRGVFFDKQSQQSLVDFYERMGNVERMSDSGDAVYVKKTV